MAVTSVIESMRTNLTNAYARAQEKGAVIPEDKNLENLADAINTISGGGNNDSNANINGIIESYYVYAGDNISAGDFVKFIEGIGSMTAGEELNNEIETICIDDSTIQEYPIRGLAIDDSRVFITYTFNAGRYAEVITIGNDGTITRGQALKISTDKRSKDVMVKLTDNTIFSVYDYAVDGGQANLFRIDGTTIVRLMTSADDAYYCGDRTAVSKIDNNHVFYTYDGYSSKEFAVVAEIGETAITFSATHQFTTWNNMSYLESQNFTLADGKIFTIYASGRGVIWEVSPNKITMITDQITNLPKGEDYKNQKKQIVTQLEPNKFLFITGAPLMGTVVTIENNQATVSEAITLIPEEEGSGSNYTIYRLADNKCVIGYVCETVENEGTDTEEYHKDVRGKIVTFNNDGTVNHISEAYSVLNSEFNADELIPCCSSDSTINMFKVGQENQNNFMIAFDVMDAEWNDAGHYASTFNVDIENDLITPTYKYSSSVINYETQVQKATATPFDGIAKTAGVGGDETAHQDQIEIYTL